VKKSAETPAACPARLPGGFLNRCAKVSAALLFLAAFAGGAARAACTVSATGLAFGPYDVFAPVPLDTTGTVTVTCDRNPRAAITISIGPSPVSGGFRPRQMRHVVLPDRLNYNLFTSPSLGTVWGDGSSGTSTVVLRRVRRRRPVTATIYGRIPPGQNVSVGAYSDALTVTITP
jgi:spore coat protein U-like protein